MLTCCLRLSLIVNDEMPMSYLPPWTPVMMVSNPAGCQSTVTPNFAATALNRSTSTPTTIFLAAAIFGGSLPLRSGPPLDDGIEGALVGPLGFEPRESEPQPAVARIRTPDRASAPRRTDI